MSKREEAIDENKQPSVPALPRVMKSWSVTVAGVVMLAAASAMAKLWLPWLLKLLDVQGDRIQALANLIQLVIWIGVAVVALIALWGRQQRDKTQEPLPITTNNQSPITLAGDGNIAFSAVNSLNHEKISIARLPVTGPNLFGREVELKLLDEAWADPDTNIVTFVALGGVGKTALVNHWLARMAKERYRGVERVFAWSFYSQGTSDERAASADLFIDAALRWFGDDDPTKGSPWDKGERLADHIRRSRTLLVLDGLEPLQHPPQCCAPRPSFLA